uniref:hypothetical protein n=1 Tax=Sedimenticola sp. TaxID=1940285 RepID=UPI003D142A6B
MSLISKLIGKIKAPREVDHPPQSGLEQQIQTLLDEIEAYVVKQVRYLYSHTRLPLKECEAYGKLKSLPAAEKIEALEYLTRRISQLHGKAIQPRITGVSNTYHCYTNLQDALMRTRIDFPEDYNFHALFYQLYNPGKDTRRAVPVTDRPFGALVMLIEKQIKRFGLSDSLREQIQTILDTSEIKKALQGENGTYYWGPDISKAARKLQKLLMADTQHTTHAVPRYELGSGVFGRQVNEDILAMPQDAQDQWNALFHHLATASAGKPSKKFLTAANDLIDAIGSTSFKAQANQWLAIAAAIPVASTEHTHTHGGCSYTYNSYAFIETHSHNLLKGLLWSMSRFHDQHSLESIALLTEKCFQKIPGQGPAAAGVGNAGIYALAQSRGLAGVGHLSRLKLRIRQNNTQKLIQTYIDQQAEKQGLKPAQIEEIAAPDFGLTDGSISQ